MDVETLRYYTLVAIRRLPIVVLAMLVFGGGGLALVRLLPPVYMASASIRVEPPQIAPDLARPTVPSDLLTQVAAIEQELFVRESLLDLADRFDIYGGRLPPSTTAVIQDLTRRIQIRFVRVGGGQSGDGAATFTVSFTHRDPVVAAAVANHLASVIVGESARRRTDRADETLAFFDQEVASLADALGKAEGDILRFKNAHIEALPDSLDFRRRQQSSMQEYRIQLEREEAGLRNRRATLVSMYQSTGQGVGDGAISRREQELADLHRLLQERLALFAPGSPSVVAVERRIAEFERPPAGEPETGTPREMPGDLKLQLADIDGRLEFIAQEKARLSGSIADLEASIARTPANEAALNHLTRGYESLGARYAAAVQRKADATIGAQIETHEKGERLKLVEPATVPEWPIKPRRLMIALASVAAGFGLGVGIVVLLELLDRRVRRAAQIVHRLGIEPLAVVPYIDAPHERLARRIRTSIVAAGATVASVGALVLVHRAVMPLDVATGRILQALGLPSLG